MDFLAAVGEPFADRCGIMVRSDESPLAAVDKVEYVETGAMYEFRNMTIGGLGEGLHEEESLRVAEAFGVPTDLY